MGAIISHFAYRDAQKFRIVRKILHISTQKSTQKFRIVRSREFCRRCFIYSLLVQLTTPRNKTRQRALKRANSAYFDMLENLQKVFTTYTFTSSSKNGHRVEAIPPPPAISTYPAIRGASCSMKIPAQNDIQKNTNSGGSSRTHLLALIPPPIWGG